MVGAKKNMGNKYLEKIASNPFSTVPVKQMIGSINRKATKIVDKKQSIERMRGTFDRINSKGAGAPNKRVNYEAKKQIPERIMDKIKDLDL